jgi:hypothetical protein
MCEWGWNNRSTPTFLCVKTNTGPTEFGLQDEAGVPPSLHGHRPLGRKLGRRGLNRSTCACGRICSRSAATLDQAGVQDAWWLSSVSEPARWRIPEPPVCPPTGIAGLNERRATLTGAHVSMGNVSMDATREKNRPQTKKGVSILFGIHPRRHLEQLAHQRYELFIAHRSPVHMLVHDDAVPRMQDQ